MTPGPVRIALCVLVAAAAAILVSTAGPRTAAEPARWFAPGHIGYERPSFGNAETLKTERLKTEVRARVGPHRTIKDGGFVTRAFSGLNGREARAWGRHNGLTPALAFSHNLTTVFPPELYNTHPEYFPLEDGKRLNPPRGSYFWNPDIARPDVARYAAEAARKHFIRHPDAPSFALGVNDALIWGESPELLALVREQGPLPQAQGLTAGRGEQGEGRRENREGARLADERDSDTGSNDFSVSASQRFSVSPTGSSKWFRERPDYSNLVFTFMNRAAEELSRTHPDKYLGALAYYWCENIPDFPVHPQVIPFLTADRSQGYDRDFRREELELQANWAKIAGPGTRDQGPGTSGAESDKNEARHSSLVTRHSEPPRRLGMYDYLYGGGFLVPRIHTKLLAENIRHARRAGFTDYYAEVNPNWGLDGITPWLTAQLLQDPEQSEAVLLDEYFRRYFREAAEPMRRFYARCEEQWMRQPGPSYWLKHYRNESQAAVFPSEVCRELRQLLHAAERLTRSNQVRARVKLVSDGFGVTERFVEFYEARDALIRLALDDNGPGTRDQGQGTAIVGPEARDQAGRTSDHSVRGPIAAALAADIGGQISRHSSPVTRHLESGADRSLSRSLSRYIAARREFIRYTVQLKYEQPLALHPFLWEDYLRNDPVPLALIGLRRVRQLSGTGDQLSGEGRGSLQLQPFSVGSAGFDEGFATEPIVAPLWAAILDRDKLVPDRRSGGAAGVELLRDAGMVGEPRPRRTIAGLPYGVSLPEPWQSKVEPAEFHFAELVDSAREHAAGRLPLADDPLSSGGTRVLRISGTKDTMVSQWIGIAQGSTQERRPSSSHHSSLVTHHLTTRPLHIGSISVRGRVSSGTAVQIIIAWLDENHRHVGFKSVRLPEGEWPGWVTLHQAGLPPAGAVWAGLGLRVQHQVAGDWIEAAKFSLRAVGE